MVEKDPLAEIKIGAVSARWAEHNQLPLRYESSTTSTNDLAKEEAFAVAAAEDVKIYLADHQTKGRGRGNNSWDELRPGAGLLSSWSYVLSEAPQPHLTPRVGLALFIAAQSVWPFLPWSLKAPNDLFLGDQKIAGLLLETLTQGPDIRLIIGLGFNVLGSPAAVANSTSLLQEMTKEVPLLGEDWAAFLDHWFLELTDAVSKPPTALTTTERESLKFALNQRPSLSQKITAIRGDGSLESGSKITSWMDL